jgi:hypothetical protein
LQQSGEEASSGASRQAAQACQHTTQQQDSVLREVWAAGYGHGAALLLHG